MSCKQPIISPVGERVLTAEFSGILRAIDERALPLSSDELFGGMWDHELAAFRSQETYTLDFKDRVPENSQIVSVRV